MCGIAGIVYTDAERPLDPGLIGAMTELIRHRGPDDDGFLIAPGAGLGMRRLSIIDPAGGHQPVFSEDGRIGVVYNGEIYNYRDLRAGLEARGHRFRTRTDTEVIAHGYEEYGDGIVRRLRGMFALALWDRQRRRLLLARDRLGKKPLHYALDSDGLAFASEIKSLLVAPRVSRALDLGALDDYVTYGYVIAPRTIFRDVRALLPGHLLVWEHGCTRIERYWDVVVEGGDDRPEAELVEELRALLNDAVSVRLMSDVPLGAFLSGGLDSSTVVAYMARHLSEPVKTFSIGFDEAGFDERDHARAVARHVGAEHHEYVVRPNMVEDLPHLLWQFDQPFADDSAIPTYYVSRMASEHVKVVLTGDGGDESFAGYGRYRDFRDDPLVRFIPQALRGRLPAHALLPAGGRGHDRLRRIRLPAAERYAEGMAVFPAQYRERLYAPEVAGALGRRDARAAYTGYFPSGADLLSAAQSADLHRYLPDDILVKVDRMSMLASLEARCPLLDAELVEFMARVPAGLKVRGGETKYLLKRAAAPLLPERILTRPKAGFNVPLGYWFRDALGHFVGEVLLSDRFAGRELFRADAVRRLIGQQQSGAGRHQRRLWALLCFELWARTYLDGDGWRTPPTPSPLRVADARPAAP